MIQEYINLYLHKRITKCAWQRYTNSRLILGEVIRFMMLLSVSGCSNTVNLNTA